MDINNAALILTKPLLDILRWPHWPTISIHSTIPLLYSIYKHCLF